MPDPSSSSSSSCSSSSMSSSSSSMSSSSSSCSSSSSSYAGFPAVKTSVDPQGNFEVLGQEANTSLEPKTSFVIINSGTAYDGYGNRLHSEDRTVFQTTTEFQLLRTDLGYDPDYAYLCVRRRSNYKLIDYMDHPVFCLPKATKQDVEIEFYLSDSLVAVDFGAGRVAYYPPLDSNQIIEGLVLCRLCNPAGTQWVVGSANKPSMIPWRSPMMAVKNGVFFPLTGFNVDRNQITSSSTSSESSPET